MKKANCKTWCIGYCHLCKKGKKEGRCMYVHMGTHTHTHNYVHVAGNISRRTQEKLVAPTVFQEANQESQGSGPQ